MPIMLRKDVVEKQMNIGIILLLELSLHISERIKEAEQWLNCYEVEELIFENITNIGNDKDCREKIWFLFICIYKPPRHRSHHLPSFDLNLIS